MLRLEDAKRILHGPQLASRDQLLVVLAIEPFGPTPVQKIKKRCAVAGLPKLAKRNISDILATSNGLAARTAEGWELQQPGILRVRSLAQAASVNLVVTHSSQSLRGHADLIADPLTKSFVMEAIYCFEAKQYRAAVVFSWAGAVALLHRVVFTTKLIEFNTEAVKRPHLKWREAKQQDDLGRMKEHDCLEMCEAIGIIGKNVKQALQQCLTLRNGCGHPNSLSIAENSVAAHIEQLIKNVFSRF